MKTPRFLITVILPAYNEEDYLGQVLDALGNINDQALQVIVVDNASTDRTPDLARSYKSVEVYTLSEKGVAKARNFGAKAAEGDILVFLDADTVPASDLFERVRNKVDQGFVGGKTTILPEKNTPYYAFFWWLDNLVDRVLFYGFGIPNICSYTPFVFCTKESFEHVGGFPTDLVAGEEIALLRRLRTRGKLCFIAESHVTTSSRRAEKKGKFLGGFWQAFYHFWFPRSKKWPYDDVR